MSNTLQPQAHARATVVVKPTREPTERTAVRRHIAKAATIRLLSLLSAGKVEI
ncbi:hypothetical protein [Bradyrhizobium sp.]|uniref:hypothetical protein n=1 Tax=Bradyrhizobium sp. TaxID=376 RepID=UPI003D0E34DB